MSGDQVAAAAVAMVGTRFRLHGRDPGEGLDCVGLAACALAAGGWTADGWPGDAVPTGYGLRGGDRARVAALLDATLARCAGEAAGDILLTVPGPGQLHLAIRSGRGIVHADAGLRRVVERPGPLPWPVIGAWRIGGD